jgi:hypothetical protein
MRAPDTDPAPDAPSLTALGGKKYAAEKRFQEECRRAPGTRATAGAEH